MTIRRDGYVGAMAHYDDLDAGRVNRNGRINSGRGYCFLSWASFFIVTYDFPTEVDDAGPPAAPRIDERSDAPTGRIIPAPFRPLEALAPSVPVR